MDIFEVIRKRRSIRSYLDKPVEEEKLLFLLDMVRQAPSASNRQEWRFVVVKDPLLKRELKKASKDQTFVEEAPVVIVCCAETDNHIMTCGQLAYPIDVAIAIDHLSLMAVALGLGTCWVGAFYEEEVKRILNIPPQIRVVELLTLGYPKELPLYHKERLPLERIAFWERWENLKV